MSHLLDSTSLSIFQLHNDYLARDFDFSIMSFVRLRLLLRGGPTLKIRTFGGGTVLHLAGAILIPFSYLFDYMACLVLAGAWIGFWIPILMLQWLF
jgi:hypothetical protein